MVRLPSRESIMSFLFRRKKVEQPRKTWEQWAKETEKGMQDVQFLLRHEFKELPDGKEYVRVNGSTIGLHGCFMVTSKSHIPYVIVDNILFLRDWDYPFPEPVEARINRLDMTLFHELVHQLCPNELTPSETLANFGAQLLLNPVGKFVIEVEE